MTVTFDGCASSTRRDRIADAGERAIAEALRYWNLDIIDPRRSDDSPHAVQSKRHIDEMLMACGWDWCVPYKGDGAMEWCGIFAGACWKAAGLDEKWIRTYFSSTYRLGLFGSYRAFDTKHPNPPPPDGVPRRGIARLNQGSTSLPFAPRAGDILTIGDGSPLDGDHICLVRSFDAERHIFHTIEGNGTGVGPDGKRRQGVVQAERRLGGEGYCARLLVRPSVVDLA